MVRQQSAVMAEQPEPNNKRKTKVAKVQIDVKQMRADLKAAKSDKRELNADIKADKANIRELEKGHKAALKPFNASIKSNTSLVNKTDKLIVKIQTQIDKATNKG